MTDLSIHTILERLRRWGRWAPATTGRQYLAELQELLRRDPSLRNQLSGEDVTFINALAKSQSVGS